MSKHSTGLHVIRALQGITHTLAQMNDPTGIGQLIATEIAASMARRTPFAHGVSRDTVHESRELASKVAAELLKEVASALAMSKLDDDVKNTDEAAAIINRIMSESKSGDSDE